MRNTAVVVISSLFVLSCSQDKVSSLENTKVQQRYSVRIFFSGILGFVSEENQDGTTSVWVVAPTNDPDRLEAFLGVPEHNLLLKVDKKFIHPQSQIQTEPEAESLEYPLEGTNLALPWQDVEERRLTRATGRTSNPQQPCHGFDSPCNDGHICQNCEAEDFQREREDLYWIAPIRKLIDTPFNTSLLLPISQLTAEDRALIGMRFKLECGALKTYELETLEDRRPVKFVLRGDTLERALAKTVMLEFHTTRPLEIKIQSVKGQPPRSLMLSGTRTEALDIYFTNHPKVMDPETRPIREVYHFQLLYNLLEEVPDILIAASNIPIATEQTADEACPPGSFD